MNTNFNFNNRSTNVENMSPQAAARTRSLMTYTFGWMALAMILSTLASVFFTFVPELAASLSVINPITGVKHPTSLFYIIALSPMIFGLVMTFGFERLSFMTLFALFMLYALFTGMSLSVLLSYYSGQDVFKAFGAATGLFGLMAIVGATTKTDLTKFGGILMMGLMGLVVAIVINWFTQSSGMSYIISVVGVAIFVGLVAYHVQNVKEIAAYDDGSELYKKAALMSAFRLYLSFVIIFRFLLSIFGRRN